MSVPTSCPRCFVPVEDPRAPRCPNPSCQAPLAPIEPSRGSESPSEPPEPAQPIPDPPERLIESARPNNPEGRDLRAEAQRFIEEHPEVYALFERFALEAAAKRRPFGIGLLAERVRWEAIVVGGASEDGYKVNNNHRAYLARKLLADHPQLEGLLRFRRTQY